MLVAAEASGDALGAGLAHALRARLGEVRFIGVGGSAMAEEGVASPFDIAQLSVLGALEGLMAYPRVVARANDTAALAAREKPDVAVLIDSWGFTLRVAHRLRRQDPRLPIVKYVGPQVWATRPGRAATLARAVDRLMTIHGFDAPYFEAAGLKTTFVGNPALARDFSAADPERLRAYVGAGADDVILLVALGSRPAEIERLAKPFEQAIHRLVANRPNVKVVVPVASTVAERVKVTIAGWSIPVYPVEGDALKYDAMKAASVALACSGTVTSELAMAGCPFVVAYKVGAVTYQVAKRLIRTRFISLLNIAAGEAIAPEFIQQDCAPEALAAALAERLDDADLRARQVAAQNAALDRLGRSVGDPSARAAEVVAEVLKERRA